jgi:signal peptidase II
MSRKQRVGVMLAVLLACVGCDQGTKRVAQQHLRAHPGYSFLADSVRLQYAENPGAFLSLGSEFGPQARQALLVVGVGAVLLALALFALLKKQIGYAELIAYALLFSGGISNWFDRLARDGTVVDFMNLGLGPLRTGIFNVADLAIVAGIVLLAWPGVFTAPRADRA